MNNFNRMTVGYAWKKSSSEFAELPFTASIDGREYSYSEASAVISKISNLLTVNNIKKSDKVAIISENRAEWGLCWLAVTTIGCVAVPVMTDFSAEQMLNILEHSEAEFLIVSDKLKNKVGTCSLMQSGRVLNIDSSSIFDNTPGADESEFLPESIDIETVSDPDDTAALIYTSGTTGASKGVLLSHLNIITNTVDSIPFGKIQPGDSMLSVLPLAHMYEFTQGFMLPMYTGANISYLGMKPSPTMLLKAIAKVRPHYILSVPLLIEKIYKNSVLHPIMKNHFLKRVYKVRVIRKLLNRLVIGKKLLKTFGGRLKFFGIGGAPLSEQVEKFLREARFPYAIGYGLTETSPLLAASGAFDTIFRGIGPAIEHVKLRISSDREIQVSGPSIMQGYYKDEQRTKEVFTEDGWFKTGDLGEIDKKGNLFIRGRLKNLILGPSGENIYPEEIENELKTYPLVSECIVLKNKNGLVARVFLDEEKLRQHLEELKYNFEEFKNNLADFQIEKEKILEILRQTINKKLNHFSRLTSIIEQELPFELTPSLKVKRFLYI